MLKRGYSAPIANSICVDVLKYVLTFMLFGIVLDIDNKGLTTRNADC